MKIERGFGQDWCWSCVTAAVLPGRWHLPQARPGTDQSHTSFSPAAGREEICFSRVWHVQIRTSPRRSHLGTRLRGRQRHGDSALSGQGRRTGRSAHPAGTRMAGEGAARGCARPTPGEGRPVGVSALGCTPWAGGALPLPSGVRRSLSRRRGWAQGEARWRTRRPAARRKAVGRWGCSAGRPEARQPAPPPGGYGRGLPAGPGSGEGAGRGQRGLPRPCPGPAPARRDCGPGRREAGSGRRGAVGARAFAGRPHGAGPRAFNGPLTGRRSPFLGRGRRGRERGARSAAVFPAPFAARAPFAVMAVVGARAASPSRAASDGVSAAALNEPGAGPSSWSLPPAAQSGPGCRQPAGWGSGCCPLPSAWQLLDQKDKTPPEYSSV